VGGGNLPALDPLVRLGWHAADGERLLANQVIFEIAGPRVRCSPVSAPHSISCSLLSGTATATRRFADAVAGTPCRILDTRKTLPGLRSAQKYAVRCGGGDNHRMGLYEPGAYQGKPHRGGRLAQRRDRAARRSAPGLTVEVEVESAAEFERRSTPGRTSSCWMTSPGEPAGAVRTQPGARPPVKLEASGSVSLETVASIADRGGLRLGGAHSPSTAGGDLSMRLDQPISRRLSLIARRPWASCLG